MINLLYIIGAIVTLILLHYISNLFYLVAVEKGWDERKFYWLSFFFGFVGWMLVIALPDRNATPVVISAPESPRRTDSNDLPPL